MSLRRIGQSSRIISGLLVYLWAMVSPSVHLLLEPHQVCLEHGELVHRHDGATPAIDLGVPADSPALGQGRERAGSDEPHVHCHLVQDRPRDTRVSGAAIPESQALGGPGTACCPREDPSPRPGLAVAPKQSPPSC